MSIANPTEALVAELYTIEGRAEIVEGRIIRMSPTGSRPSRASGLIFASLLAAEEAAKGRAYPDNVAYVVNLPGRKSFSPDASFYAGPETGMKFLEGAPALAVEVRSENDYGPKAERKIADKRADYFAAGTKVVWDVDLLSDDVVRSYRYDAPEAAEVFRRGDVAHAEPAVPGWTIAVDSFLR